VTAAENARRPDQPGAELVLSDQTRPQASAQGNEASRSADGGALDLTLDTGAAFMLPAAQLRAACRCAHCRRAQIDGTFPDQFPSVAIVGVTPIGHYAVNLEFSDGHARGIYPWSYLARLAADPPA
jgi:DUF971 family protein